MEPSVRIDPRAVESFRHLCELVHRPTANRLEKGLAFDWSQVASLQRELGLSRDPLTPESVGAATRAFLTRTLEELRSAYPSDDDRLSPLDVIEHHLVEGHSWDAITTERMERGSPVSERTLRTRQREGLQIVLEHAIRAVEAPEAPDDTAGSDATRTPRARGHRIDLRAVGALAAVVLLAGSWIASSRLSGSTKQSLLPLGQEIGLGGGQLTMPDPYPAWNLPVIDSAFERAIVVEPEPGVVYVLLSAAQTGPDAGAVVLYDPITERILWQDRFVPEAGEIGSPPEVDPGAATELYRASQLVYGRRGLNLGPTAMVVFVQRHSPCFVVEYDLQSGARLGQYYHPGRLESHLVEDVGDDGQAEIYLGGQDNVVDRPALVQLHPGALRGGASTAPGPHGHGVEDACVRLFLPSDASLQDHWGVDRLQVANGISHRWDPVHRILSFDVGASNEDIAYRARLTPELRPVEESAISVGEASARIWTAAGLDPDDAEDLAGGFLRLEGRGCGSERAR